MSVALDDGAAEHLARARAAADEARPDQVAAHVAAGLAVAGDDATRLRLRLTGAMATAEYDDHDTALAALARLVPEAERLGSRELVALCRAQTAFVHLLAGELSAAADLLAILDVDAMDPADRARVLLNRGTLAAHLRPGAGEADLRAGVRLAEAGHRPDLAFRGTHNLGWLAFLRGDLVEALRLMQRAEEIDAPVDRAVAALDRARVLLEAGLVEDARTVLRDTADGAFASGQNHTAAEILLELARADLLAGRPGAARDRAGKAYDVFRRHGATGWSDRARLLVLGLEVGRGDARTERELAALHARAVGHGDLRASVECRLVQVETALGRGRPARARHLLEGLPVEARPGPASIALRLRILGLRARIADAQGRPERASRLLRQAGHELALARTRQVSLDLRTAMAVHARPAAELDIDLGVRTGRPWPVLVRAEHWRAAADHLPTVRPPAAALADEAAAAALLRLRAAREDIRTAAPGSDTSGLLAQARACERQLRLLAWTDPAQAPTPLAPVSRRELVATLAQEGYGLVSFVPHRGRLLAVVVAPGSADRLLDLGPTRAAADLAAGLRAGVLTWARTRTAQALTAAVRASVHADLERLSAMLLRPALAHLDPDRPLVCVPTLDLPNLPWGMLPGARGRPLTVARSAAAWVHGVHRCEQTSRLDPGVGALAGPGIASADAEALAVTEIWRARGWPTEVVDTASSSPDRLRGLLATHELVHIAAHGNHDQTSPLFSSVRTGAGPAFAHELERAQTTARHVVLAACDTGRATLRPGDEALGLTATMLALGVSSVVAPTTVVPDDDAHALVLAHHAALAGGLDSVHALARAVREAPLLAGAFTAFGAAWAPRQGGGDSTAPAPSPATANTRPGAPTRTGPR